MEEMNNVMENTVTEIVEEATDKLTLGQNVAAYGIAFTFGIGVATIAYAGYKGAKYLAGKIKSKKEVVDQSEGEVIDVENEDIKEDIDDTEER